MRVLISGAGIAGPTLAWFLAKAGARVTIIEKSRALLPYGQNVDMQGGAVTVIKKMALMDEFRKLNTTEQGTQFIDTKGQPFAPFPLNGGSTASPTSEYEILRADLAALLYKATKDHPNITYLLGTTVKAVVTNDSYAVKVTLSDGELQKFDLMVVADGQWSKLRKQCFPMESVHVVDTGMRVAYWTVPRLPCDNNWWNVYVALRSRLITIRPDPHGTVRAMVTCMPCSEAKDKVWLDVARSDRQTQEKFIREEFADAGWQMERLLDGMKEAPDFYFQVIQQIRMSKWSNSRIVCLGDSAFAPTALTGMGTSLAIVGAYTLAGELSKLNEGDHPSKALESYESIFRPFVEETQKIPSFIPSVMHPETAWKRWLLQRSMSGIAKIVTTTWVAKRLPNPDIQNDGFPLPNYPIFD